MTIRCNSMQKEINITHIKQVISVLTQPPRYILYRSKQSAKSTPQSTALRAGRELNQHLSDAIKIMMADFFVNF